MKQTLVNYPNKFRAVFAGKQSSAVAISIRLCFGAEQEPRNLSGVTYLIEKVLKSNISSAISAFGGVVETRTDFEHIEITISTLRPYVANALIALSSAIFDFSPKYAVLEREKSKALSEIEKAKFNPLSILNSITQKQMYRGTNLATDIVGNEKTIPNITLDVMKEYYNSVLTSDSLIISLVGDICDIQLNQIGLNDTQDGNTFINEHNSKELISDEKWIIPSLDMVKNTGEGNISKVVNSYSQVLDLVNKYFYVRTLELKDSKRKKKTKYTVPDGNVFIEKMKPLNQTRFQISFPSAPYNSAGYKYGKVFEDYLAFYLRQSLSDMQGIYGVSTSIRQFKENGHISITFAVDEDQAKMVYNKVISLLIQLSYETLTNSEFSSAVTKYKTLVALKHERISDLALRYNKWLYLKDKLFNLDNELIAIDSLSYNNFIYICKQTLDFSKMVVVCLGRKIEDFEPFALIGGNR